MKKIFIIFVLTIVFPSFTLASSFDYTWSTIDLTQEVSTTLGNERS